MYCKKGHLVTFDQSLQWEQIICICADICTFPDLHYRHEQTSAPFYKVSIWSKKKRAERTVPSLGGHCKQANFAIFCSALWWNIRFSKSWSSYLLIFWVLSQKKGCFLAGKGLCYVLVKRFCRDMSFVAFTCFFGLVLMQTFMQTLRILCRYCADFCTKKCSLEALA